MADLARVWGYVGVRECGCAFFCAMPHRMADAVADEDAAHLREAMADGRIRSVMSSDEFAAFSWRCSRCKPESQPDATLTPAH
jgi:hypothetical protein